MFDAAVEGTYQGLSGVREAQERYEFLTGEEAPTIGEMVGETLDGFGDIFGFMVVAFLIFGLWAHMQEKRKGQPKQEGAEPEVTEKPS